MVDKIHKLHYGRMVEDALRWVMREALVVTEQHGLPGAHHFYITFRTRYPGVEIACHLLEHHPDEMTIVLQNQFWGLEVGETGFAVTLSFNKVSERLQIPFAAITAFTDPAAKFGLQFNADSKIDGLLLTVLDNLPNEGIHVLSGGGLDHNSNNDMAEKGGNVIAFDAFRKK